jgi:hypothetical protein
MTNYHSIRNIVRVTGCLDLMITEVKQMIRFSDALKMMQKKIWRFMPHFGLNER